MPSEDIEIFEFNQCQKSDNTPSTIYAGLESILENIDGCKNNPENSSTMKIINFEKKKMKLLTEKQKESYENEFFFLYL